MEYKAVPPGKGQLRKPFIKYESLMGKDIMTGKEYPYPGSFKPSGKDGIAGGKIRMPPLNKHRIRLTAYYPFRSPKDINGIRGVYEIPGILRPEGIIFIIPLLPPEKKLRILHPVGDHQGIVFL